MKQNPVLFMTLLILLAASPAFAGGHDSHGSGEHGASHDSSQAPGDDQNSKESETLLDNSARYVGRIYQRIERLQTEIKGKHVSASVREELKKLEQNLKEANDIIRSLQIL